MRCTITDVPVTDLFVPLGENDVLDPSPVGSQHLLLDTAHLQR